MTPTYDPSRVSSFIQGLSALTGMSERKLQHYAKEHNLFNLLEHPHVIETTPRQLEKLQSLNQFLVAYKLLKLEESQGKVPFKSADIAGAFFSAQLGRVKDKEKFMVAFLDNGNHLIEARVMSEGSVDMAQVYPREVLKAALNCDCASIIMAHNHPGGSLKPSMEDLILTERLVSIFDPLHISVLDHFIIANGTYASMAQLQKMPQPSDKQICYESIPLRSARVNEIPGFYPDTVAENHWTYDDGYPQDTERDEYER